MHILFIQSLYFLTGFPILLTYLVKNISGYCDLGKFTFYRVFNSTEGNGKRN